MNTDFPYKLFWLLFTVWGIAGAQNNRWIDLFSYLRVEHIQKVNDKIYAQSENALFIYDTGNNELEKISSINGLSGDKISNFYFHAGLKKLFIFHTNGLIEVIDAQKNVFKSPDLANNSFINTNQKKLYDIFARNEILYLATGYGISTYNLERNEFGDTYYTDNNAGLEKINAIEIIDNTIYAATEHGLKKASLTDNLIDFNVWQVIDPQNWQKLAQNNQMLIAAKGKQLYKYENGNFHNLISLPFNIKNIQINNYILLTTEHKVYAYNTSYLWQKTFEDTAYTGEIFFDALDAGNDIYIATKKHGILKTPLASIRYTELHPDSPLSNHVFAVDARENHCWIVYGDHVKFNPYPLFRQGASSYQDGHWVNIPYEAFNVSDLCFVKINPTNVQEVYISSAKDGLFRIKNNQIDRYFDETNSLIQNFDNNGARVFAMDFDSQNNLWITQRLTPTLLKLKPDDTWEGVSLQAVLPDISDYHGFDELKVDDEDNIWLGSEYIGVIGYNQQTHQITADKKGIEPASFTYITGLDIDKNNTMWVGNFNGLWIMPNPQKMFDDPNLSFKPIKIVYEESVQLLMEGQSIQDICVDGSNNKWIATLGSGAYYFSEDGTRTIYHFTKENSPLSSNDIYDIAVDGSTGMVYFATLNGMIGFKGNATDAGENMDDVYAFPNPVNQQKHRFVTIRGLLSGVSVKIVDVAGNLVYEAISKGGSITWNLTAFGKYKVASGVYIALISNDDGTKTQTTKILVIK